MKPQDCAKYSDCPKIDMIADKDILDFQFQESDLKVCGECKEGIGRGELEELVKFKAEERDKLQHLFELQLESLLLQINLLGEVTRLVSRQTVKGKADGKPD